MAHIQEPVAIVGFSCRLLGGNKTPDKLWEFLNQGEDGSLKPGTMPTTGGMFLEGVDPADFDAAFFEISARMPSPWIPTNEKCWK
ncbi:uncharacterized protein BO97DRAFT_424213 [Aspergillus homomorphus CBS 101889]|uniref:Beta-ketoacyl synthase-like N-terminal domain-containing protein n=1 Tax=Aspergillus homomorphus (strain CBS 101889) TaxID=1450537 RepID=A0A395HZ16_ASPHC|nr:hypothetical protein BO97DRAFT_424213 [Aspergillus homomorphus CBS 101889]RAL13040.1 hypothetical protein BO97DRAFT_424213 [Aspergillus homomorphus CBS 101889]